MVRAVIVNIGASAMVSWLSTRLPLCSHSAIILILQLLPRIIQAAILVVILRLLCCRDFAILLRLFEILLLVVLMLKHGLSAFNFLSLIKRVFAILAWVKLLAILCRILCAIRWVTLVVDNI